jgi:hypothetical protein
VGFEVVIVLAAQRIVGFRMMIVLERYNGSQILLRLRRLYWPDACFEVSQSVV